MIFADKLIYLRKKSGWSQEELSEQMDVSRQSISKWEGAQTIPDLDKIIKLSKLFGVSTDYLLKDEIEETETICEKSSDEEDKFVSLEEANEFIEIKKSTVKSMIIAVMLCIMSPMCMLVFLGMSSEKIVFSNEAAIFIGVSILLAMVAVAVGMFIIVGGKTQKFEFLEKDSFKTEYGVIGSVEKQKEEFKPTYIKYNAIGTVLCILSAVPIVCATMLSDKELYILCSVALALLIVAVGVAFFLKGGIIYSSFEQILQEGEYTKKSKSANSIMSIYWLIVTAGYLVYSFITNDWGRSWIVWPAAGVLSPIVKILLMKRKDK